MSKTTLQSTTRIWVYILLVVDFSEMDVASLQMLFSIDDSVPLAATEDIHTAAECTHTDTILDISEMEFASFAPTLLSIDTVAGGDTFTKGGSDVLAVLDTIMAIKSYSLISSNINCN